MKPELDEEARERLKKLSATFFGALSMTAALAAPRYLAKADISKQPTQSQLLELYDEFVIVLEQPGPSSPTKYTPAIAPARRLRAALDDWEFSLQAPPSVQAAARELMEAMGMSEPDEGWDEWEGPTE